MRFLPKPSLLVSSLPIRRQSMLKELTQRSNILWKRPILQLQWVAAWRQAHQTWVKRLSKWFVIRIACALSWITVMPKTTTTWSNSRLFRWTVDKKWLKTLRSTMKALLLKKNSPKKPKENLAATGACKWNGMPKQQVKRKKSKKMTTQRKYGLSKAPQGKCRSALKKT